MWPWQETENKNGFKCLSTSCVWPRSRVCERVCVSSPCRWGWPGYTAPRRCPHPPPASSSETRGRRPEAAGESSAADTCRQRSEVRGHRGAEVKHNWSEQKTKSIKTVSKTRHSHFLEEVPVGDDLELLQDQEDPTADEEGLVFGQSFVQQQQVPLAVRQRHTSPDSSPDTLWCHFLCHCLRKERRKPRLTSQLWWRRRTASGRIFSGADESACDPERPETTWSRTGLNLD